MTLLCIYDFYFTSIQSNIFALNFDWLRAFCNFCNFFMTHSSFDSIRPLWLCVVCMTHHYFFMHDSIQYFCFITWFDNKTVLKCGSYDLLLCSVCIQSRIFAFNFAWSSACCNSCNFFRTPSNRYRSRFIEQVGHETTHASSGNKHFLYIQGVSYWNVLN